ncbi:MAG: restriction endonuclease subunit S [Bacteroidetes bacterium]|nr:restriction endonuclease subunit S [Bacteroidota bacterium]
MKKHWEVKKLGEVLKLEYGKPLPDFKRKSDGAYPVYGANGEKDRTDEYYHDKQSIIVGRKGSAGEINFTEDRFWPLDVTYFVTFDEKKYDLKFLHNTLLTLELPKLAKGVKPGINRNEVYAIEVRIPPLSEQQRIVAILDEAFAAIATAKENAAKNLQNARSLFESHLESVFTQRGEGWVEKPLGEVCERITKGSSPKWQGIAYVDKPGVLFVTSENVGEYQILLEQPKYVEEKFNAKDKKSILKRGDVLTNIVGASIGRTAVFELDDVANINQAVCLIRCEPALLNNFFLTYLLNSPVFKQVLHDNEVNNARANLSLSFFSQLLVPMPQLSKQQEIVAKLDALREETQRLEVIYWQKLNDLDELKKSVLKKAFDGEL